MAPPWECVRHAIGNRRAAAATDIENSVVIAGVVQTLYADWGASHHYAVAGEVVHARPSADVPGARVRRPAAAVLDDAGQYVADAWPTPSITEARDSDAAT